MQDNRGSGSLVKMGEMSDDEIRRKAFARAVALLVADAGSGCGSSSLTPPHRE